MLILDRRMRDVANWLQDATPRLADLMLERIRADVPAYFASGDPGFLDMARESVVANLEAIAEALHSGRDQTAQLPPGAVEEALLAARERMAWSLIDRTYRIGHAVLWEQLLSEVESWRLESAERLELLRVLSHFLFRYVDDVTEQLSDVHQAERDRHVRGRERRRIAWVREVLAEVSASSSGGDYDLGRQHLGAVAWGLGAEAAISDVGRALDAVVLVVPGQGSAAWGWLGTHGLPGGWLDVASAMALPSDTFLAFGTPASGADGFRLTHRQALEAARVVRRTGAALGAYDDVSLQALMLRDERAARDFVDRELGPLLEGGKRTQALLETLRVYVDSGWNAASAGAQLGIHDRTVGYRLAAIEQRLGRPLRTRRDELGVALRLAETLS